MDEWKDEVHGKDVKKILTVRPLLKLPDLRKKYYINFDACIIKARRLEATISQDYTTPPPDPNFIRRMNKHKEGRFLKVVEYWNRLLTDRERSAKPSAFMTPSCIGLLFLTTVFHSLSLSIT
jgi:hypothetical protein